MWLRKPQTLPDHAAGKHIAIFVNRHLVTFLKIQIWRHTGVLPGVMKELEDLVEQFRRERREGREGDRRSILHVARMVQCTRSGLDGPFIGEK